MFFALLAKVVFNNQPIMTAANSGNSGNISLEINAGVMQ